MIEEARQEHRWLEKMLGEWTYESECVMGPDQPPMKSQGAEVVRSLGGLWVIAEGENEIPEGGTARTIMTLGFDARRGRYVGTFIASMMTFLWVYDGALDATGRVLTLDVEGPNFQGGETFCKYQDIIEFLDDDHRTMTSRLLTGDGQWVQFMKAHYRRKPSGA